MKTEIHKEFCKKTEALIKFLNNNFHPHAKIIITTNNAELVEGVMNHKTNRYIND